MIRLHCPAPGEVFLSKILSVLPLGMTDLLLAAPVLYICIMDWLELEKKQTNKPTSPKTNSNNNNKPKIPTTFLVLHFLSKSYNHPSFNFGCELTQLLLSSMLQCSSLPSGTSLTVQVVSEDAAQYKGVTIFGVTKEFCL